MSFEAKNNAPAEQTVLRRDDRFLRREYRKVLFPVMFSVLGGVINALIDSVFVSRRIGVSGLTAVNLSMPVYLVLCMLGSLIASGAAVLSARAEGRDDLHTAERLYHTALTAGLCAGALVTLLGLVFLGPLSGFLTGRGSVRAEVEAYCRVTLAGSAVYVMGYIPLYYLQLEGKTAQISRMIAIMVGADAVLDYVLLYPLDLGMTGAALASVAAMLVSCAYGFAALSSGFSNYRFRIRGMNLRGLGEITRYGSPAALGNLYDAGKLLAVNTFIFAVAGESAAAVWAVLNTLSELSMVVTLGAARSGSAMVGVYCSARENDGIRTLVRLECIAGTILSGLFALAAVLLSGAIEALYRLSEPMKLPLLCLGVGVIFNTLCCVMETCFNSEGRIALSNLLVALRRLILPVAALPLLRAAGTTMWLFLPLSGLMSLAACLIIPAALSKRSEATDRPLSRFLLLDDTLKRTRAVLDFSIPGEIGAVCEAAERIHDFCELHEMEPRLVMRLQLSIEELLNVIVTKNPGLESVDLRAFALEGITGIRIRCAGRNYNPFEDDDPEDDFLMGVRMLKKMADVTTHTFTLGTNSINIIFGRDKLEDQNGPQ
ncbi:MAG: hypothetical protein ILP09_06445 [Oscillospiraceae bacterium]|nr:hypothetical protein [Oscillospiraceae bacterium]